MFDEAIPRDAWRRQASTGIAAGVTLTARHRAGRKTVVTPMRQSGDAAIETRADPALLEALALAFRYQRMLHDRHCASVTEMAAAEKIERGYLGSLLRLTLLAPDIVQVILDGRAPPDLALPRLLEPFPTSWAEQHVVFSVR